MKDRLILGLLKCLAYLPLRALYLFSDLAFFVIYYLIGYRKEVVTKNLTEAFPRKNKKEIKEISRSYYRYLSDQIVETVKVFHISDKEMKRRVTVSNYEIINASLSIGKNVVLYMGHYGNWEWVQEISRYFIPTAFMASLYRPLADHTWDEIYKTLRSRWGAHMIPINMSPRTLLNRDNFPWVCGFIADQRPGKRSDDNWIEFLHHKTWFYYGPEEIGKKTDADFFYLEMLRKGRGKYEIVFHPLKDTNSGESFPVTREFWRKFEKTIRENPPYWLWSHKRWK